MVKGALEVPILEYISISDKTTLRMGVFPFYLSTGTSFHLTYHKKGRKLVSNIDNEPETKKKKKARREKLSNRDQSSQIQAIQILERCWR